MYNVCSPVVRGVRIFQIIFQSGFCYFLRKLRDLGGSFKLQTYIILFVFFINPPLGLYIFKIRDRGFTFRHVFQIDLKPNYSLKG